MSPSAVDLKWAIGDEVGASVGEIQLAWSNLIPVKPTPRQLAFLLLPVQEALYGGAGGGGKSIALMMAALQYADYPKYAALIIRRTFTDLSLPSALLDVSREWLTGKAKWKDQEKTWEFPNGASLTFGYLSSPKDKFRYQSAAFQFIAFDELTQFPESDYNYMFSRLRKLKDAPVPTRLRAASNPGNIGHEWVKKRFLPDPDPVTGEIPRSPNRAFIPAKLSDNPYIDQEEYLRSLAELDPITRKQIMDGDWTARHGGNKFLREWFEIVNAAPADLRCVRFWDMAATEPKAGRDPDWTVGLKLGISSQNTLYLLDIIRVRATPKSTEDLIKQTAMLDGRHIPVRMEQEPGSSGIKAIDDYKRRVLMGWDFQGVRSTGSKEVRANPVASQAEAGNIKMVNAKWVQPFLDEVELFPTGSHDDQVDALSGALAALTTFSDKPFMVG